MPSLWFIVPAHGRTRLARICLRQLRRTCEQLTDAGIDATAVVIANDENLDTARDLGFAWVERDNTAVSRKFNDGIELACTNPRPADYVVPCGSDDWVHPDLFADLPGPHTVYAFQHMSFVREDGREIATTFLNYEGGAGIRIFPRALLAPLAYRPADENRSKGCDTSILLNLRHEHAERPFRVDHRVADPRAIVDWKSTVDQITSYADIKARHRQCDLHDPFDTLTGYYPDEALEEMAAHYGRVAVAA